MQVNVSSGSEPTFVYGVVLVQTHRWSYNVCGSFLFA